MDGKSNQDAHGHRPTVSGLASDELYNMPMNESSFALVDATKTADSVSVAPLVREPLPARRIELRYWVGALALGAAMWIAILVWL